MYKYIFCLFALCLFVGCEDSGWDFVIDFDTPTVTETTDKEQDTNEEEVFPGSVIVTGKDADEVIAKMEDELWLSDSGILHNSLCRWYKKCSGKVWDKEAEHTNCKNCGGTEPIVREWNLNKTEDK